MSSVNLKFQLKIFIKCIICYSTRTIHILKCAGGEREGESEGGREEGVGRRWERDTYG